MKTTDHSLRAHALGLLLALAIPAIVWNPRGAAFVVPVLVILVAALLGRSGRWHGLGRIVGDWRVAAAVGFLLYAMLASGWSPDVASAAWKTSLLAALVIGTALGIMTAAGHDAAAVGPLGRWIWLGYLGAIIFAFADIMSGQALKVWGLSMLGLDTSSVISPRFFARGGDGRSALVYEALSRHAAPIVLLLWPALLSARSSLSHGYGTAIIALLALLTTATLLVLPLETAKLALLAGTTALAMALLKPMAARWTVAAGWCVLCLGFPLLAVAAHRLDLQHATWLPPSAQHRIVIWNDLTRGLAEAPVLGHGPDAVYARSAAVDPSHAPTDPRFPHRVRHAHSLYLQTWYELGGIGIVLLTAFGLAILSVIGRLGARAQPYALASFTSASVLMAATFGMWQPWIMGTLVHLAFLTTLAMRATPPDLSSGR